MPSIEMTHVAFDAPGLLTPADAQRLKDQTIVVPHTYDRKMCADALSMFPDRRRYFSDENPVHVCYVGNLYGTRGADLVLNASRRLVCTTPGRRVLTHVFGRVDRRSRRQLSGGEVVFHGGVNYLESLAMMQHADALLLVDVPITGSPFFPSKLADYLGSDRPIIVIAEEGSAVERIGADMHLVVAGFDETPIIFDLAVSSDDIQRRRAYARRTDVRL